MHVNKQTEIRLDCVLGGPIEILNGTSQTLTNVHLHGEYRNPEGCLGGNSPKLQVFSQLYSFVSNLNQNYPYPVAEVFWGNLKVQIIFQCTSENALIAEVGISQKSAHELCSSMKLYVSHNQSCFASLRCRVSLHREYTINDQCHPKISKYYFRQSTWIISFKFTIMLSCKSLCYFSLVLVSCDCHNKLP